VVICFRFHTVFAYRRWIDQHRPEHRATTDHSKTHCKRRGFITPHSSSRIQVIAQLSGGRQEVAESVGFGGCAGVVEDGERRVPVGQRGVGSLGAADGVAEDAEGASFAEPVPGLAVDGERLAGVLGRLAGSATGQLDLGQGGAGVPFQDPVAGLAGQLQRLHGLLRRLVQPVEVPVGGGQADDGVDLLDAGVGLVRQLPCLLVPLQGGAMAAQTLFDVAEGLQGSGFDGLAADLAGELEASPASSSAWS
jgi:hypothetical protein